MAEWGCVERLLRMKQKIAVIERRLTDPEMEELERLNDILDRHTKTCEMIGKCPWSGENI
jgi:hypothetical protein